MRLIQAAPNTRTSQGRNFKCYALLIQPEHLPFLATADGDDIKSNQIYVRCGCIYPTCYANAASEGPQSENRNSAFNRTRIDTKGTSRRVESALYRAKTTVDLCDSTRARDRLALELWGIY